MYILVLWFAKLIQFFTRKIGHGGSALPGLLVEKISNNFLKHFLNKIPEGVVVISGTNGKTTTSKLIVGALEMSGKKVFTNRSGSNMTRGLISAVISHADVLGRMPYDIAILEVDEAYAAKLANEIPIKGAVILNVMRDQLDRFGEIDNTSKLLSELSKSAQSFVVLNADDSRVNTLPSFENSKRSFFGLSSIARKQITSEEDLHSNHNKIIRIEPEFILNSSSGNECEILAGKQKYTLNTKISGVHNHLNLTAALACLRFILREKDLGETTSHLEQIEPAFGRGENIIIAKSRISLQLVKNPSSFTQTVKSCNLEYFDTVSVVINDAYADGRDVSWLWDVDFSIFKKAKKIFVSGTRAYDLAVRLRHENISISEAELDENLLATKLVSLKGSHVIFCTYTGMLKLRKFFVKKGHLEKVL